MTVPMNTVTPKIADGQKHIAHTTKDGQTLVTRFLQGLNLSLPPTFGLWFGGGGYRLQAKLLGIFGIAPLAVLALPITWISAPIAVRT